MTAKTKIFKPIKTDNLKGLKLEAAVAKAIGKKYQIIGPEYQHDTAKVYIEMNSREETPALKVFEPLSKVELIDGLVKRFNVSTLYDGNINGKKMWSAFCGQDIVQPSDNPTFSHSKDRRLCILRSIVKIKFPDCVVIEDIEE